MVSIIVNGKTETITPPVTLQAFLEARSLDPEAVVVEYNEKILNIEALKQTELRENDRLELLSFVGGG